ncbi:MAG TPA: transposase [Armatimonadota bacterium]
MWCEDEAGPYQAIPQPGASWEPRGHPATQPHEYHRGGTAKLLTLLRPATGEVRGRAVTRTTNAVIHPWLQGELSAILAAQTSAEAEETVWQHWAAWNWPPERVAVYTDAPAPTVRLLLVLDNLKGHYTKAFVAWCLERGIALLYTPLGGSCYNMAESVQRILIRRALDGQHSQTPQEVMEALTAVVTGWNAQPTPFQWGGKRRERRRRAKERRHQAGGSHAYTRRPVVGRWTRQSQQETITAGHDK